MRARWWRSGTPEKVLTEELIRQVFGVEVSIRQSSASGRRHIEYLVDHHFAAREQDHG